jgi:hypothetical protein
MNVTKGSAQAYIALLYLPEEYFAVPLRIAEAFLT